MVTHRHILNASGKVLARAFLLTLATGGILVTGAVAPNIFVALKNMASIKEMFSEKSKNERTKRVWGTFSYLLKKGLIKKEYHGKQLYISITQEGRKKAKRWHIDSLRISPLKHWDRKWRMVLFDVDEDRKVTREALRGKLKELGFFQLQKSVWIHAYPCVEELAELQEFFDLDERRFICFEIAGLPKMYERVAKVHFKIRE